MRGVIKGREGVIRGREGVIRGCEGVIRGVIKGVTREYKKFKQRCEGGLSGRGVVSGRDWLGKGVVSVWECLDKGLNTFAFQPLFLQSPEHLSAVVTIGRLEICLLFKHMT